MFVFVAGPTELVGLGGGGLPIFYNAVPAGVSRFQFTGGGYDQAWMLGTGVGESAALAPNSAILSGPAFQVSVDHVFQAVVMAEHGPAQGGDATLSLVDSPGNDLLTLGPSLTSWTGLGFQDYATAGFARIAARSSAGADTAAFVDASGNGNFAGTFGAGCTLSAAGATATAAGFQMVYAYVPGAGAGFAWLANDSGTPAQFPLSPAYSFMRQLSTGATVFLQGYAAVAATAGPGGADQASLVDLTGAASLTASASGTILTGTTFALSAAGFAEVAAYASPGTAQALLYDSSGDDRFTARNNQAILNYGTSPTNFVAVVGFQRVTAVSSQGGFDVEFVYPGVNFQVQTLGNWR